MDELENMKSMWIELNQRISTLEEENRRLARKVMNDSMKSSQEKLIKKYNTFIIIELVVLLIMPLYLLKSPLLVDKYRILTAIYWAFFFLLEVGVDLYLRERVRTIDLYTSTVSVISRQAAQNWKFHKIAVIVGLPIAIGACVLFGLTIGANELAIYGMIVGGLVGLVIGINQLIKFRQYYYKLQSHE